MFLDRYEAGQILAGQLQKYYRSSHVVAIPRGGVLIGYEVAKKLQAPLHVVIARKMGSLQNPELGIGAISEEGVVILDSELISLLKISADEVDEIEKREREELKRRVVTYRKGKGLDMLLHQVVILVDDGLATGVTVKAAIMSLSKFQPLKIILAVPICAAQTAASLSDHGVSVICTQQSDDLRAIGRYYRDFHQIEDDEVIHLLKESKNSLSLRQMVLGF